MLKIIDLGGKAFFLCEFAAADELASGQSGLIPFKTSFCLSILYLVLVATKAFK